MPGTSPVPDRVTLRPARAGDRAEAVRIQLEAFEALTRAAWRGWDPAQAEAGMLAEWQTDQTRCMWLDGSLIGFTRVAHRPGYDWLDLLVVAVRHQGAGIGGAVLDRLQQEAARRGAPLWLSVYRINPARDLYARCGFSAHPRDPVRVLMGYPADAPPPPELLQPGPTRS